MTAKKELDDIIHISKRCSQFGMCKVDFLSTGICKSGTEKKYSSYFPQGRMELATAIYENLIQVTPRLIDIVETCSLCKICRKQCYFQMELNSLEVMKALKQYVKRYLDEGNEINTVNDDETLKSLRNIVGDEWAENDPAILITYSKVRSPFMPRTIPQYVVLPQTTEEVAEIVKFGKKYNIPVLPRGNGTSFFGALTEGIVLDLIRFNTLKVNKENYFADIGAGVTAFELQKEAHKFNLRANTAEAAACVCANVVSTNLHSLFSHSYGVGADNYIDAEVVTLDGDIHYLNDKNCPNYFTLNKNPDDLKSPPIICTNMKIKLNPIVKDEECIVIPFSSFHDCFKIVKEISARRIGYAVGMLGTEYLSNFMSPTIEDARKVKMVLEDKLGIKHFLLVMGDKYAIKTIKDMVEVYIDQDLFNILQFNLTELHVNMGLEVMSEIPNDEELFKVMFKKEMLPLLRMSMTSTIDSVADSVPEDLKKFFKELYSDPKFLNLCWLTTFRISSARIGRGHMFVPRILWLAQDEDIILKVSNDLKAIADKYNVKNDFGYLVPIELGKRVIIEYDYYFDHADEEEKQNAMKAISESVEIMSKFKNEIAGITLGSEIALQGLSRPEAYLYAK